MKETKCNGREKSTAEKVENEAEPDAKIKGSQRRTGRGKEPLKVHPGNTHSEPDYEPRPGETGKTLLT